MRKSTAWWFAGALGIAAGVVALVARARAKAQGAAVPEGVARPGDLQVEISLGSAPSMPVVNNLLNAVLGARDVCSNFPPIISAQGTPAVSGTSIMATYTASWTHGIMGDIREDVRQCLLSHLRGVTGEVLDVRATRTS